MQFNKRCLQGKGGGVENHENNGYLHYGWLGMGLEFWCEILEVLEKSLNWSGHADRRFPFHNAICLVSFRRI